MRIRKLHIKNYRGLNDVILDDLTDLVVFAGPDVSDSADLLNAIELFFKSLDGKWQAVEPEPILKNQTTIITTIVPIEFASELELDKTELTRMLLPQISEQVALKEKNMLEVSYKLVKDPVSRKWQARNIRIESPHVFLPKPSDSAPEILDTIAKNIGKRFELAHAYGWVQEPEAPEQERKQASVLVERILNELGVLSHFSSSAEDYEDRNIEERAREACSKLDELHFWFEYAPTVPEFAREKDAGEHSVFESGSRELAGLYCQLMSAQKGIVVGLEEPKRPLVPKVRRQIVWVLKKLSHRNQVLVVSSSTILTDEADPQDIWVVRRDRSETQVHKINASTEMKSLLSEFDLRISDILNARGLIFVESPTERATFPIWAEKIGIDFNKLGFSIIPVYEKPTATYHFPVWISAAEQIDVPYYFVLSQSRVEEGSEMKNMKDRLLLNENLFFLSRPSIEDYFPDHGVSTALQKLFDIEVPEKGKALPSPKSNSIEKLIVAKGKDPAGWNILVGDAVARSMSKDQIDDEIKNILIRITKSYGK